MKLETAQRLVLSLSVLCLGLIAICVLLFARGNSRLGDLESTLSNPELRAEVVDELVAQGQGIYDSFHDADVGRVLQPNLDRQPERGDDIVSNRFGMRERDYAMPKEPETTRIVLLGDSYVFGAGVDAGERLGVFLESFLAEREIERAECLHLAVSSWNILSECAFVRRQLHLLKPDVVIQIVVNNDLDDLAGVRGFGSMARFSPQHRDRSVGVIGRRFPASSLGFNANGFVAHGLDYESRSRYAEAAEAIGSLADATAELGGEYLLVLNFMGLQPVAMERLTTGLQARQWTTLPRILFREDRYRVSPRDGHWSPEGHRAVATYLYSLMQGREFLELPEWEEASNLEREWVGLIEDELPDPATSPDTLLGQNEVANSVEFDALNVDTARQVHGGIYGGGVAPYASIMLRNEGANRLELVGRFLPNVTLNGAVIRIYVDEFLVKELEVRSREEFRVVEPLPSELDGRRFVSVRLQGDDFAYYGDTLEFGIICGLQSVALTP